MEHNEFIEHIKYHVAELAVGASSLRNQGGSGLIETAREYFKKIDLVLYGSMTNQDEFRDLLDKDTSELQCEFPTGAQNWGAARKAMNLFLRDAVYNRFLFREFELGRLEEWLEIPVDNDVARGIIADVRSGVIVLSPGESLPTWKNIKSLTPEQNSKFQDVAKAIGHIRGISRVHVDLLYWRRKNN